MALLALPILAAGVVEVAVTQQMVRVVTAALALSSFHTQTYMRRQHLQQVHQL
jgi:hypothetical protein